MFIQTEITPNPAALKFLPNCRVIEEGTVNFRDPLSAEHSPLAQKLFQIQGVIGVFFGTDFVTVSKHPEYHWDTLKPMILSVLMEYFLSGTPVLLETSADDSESVENFADEDTEIVTQIKELLDTQVRPFVVQDGGDISFHGFDKGIVYLNMRGACAGCPSSTATLKAGIENLLRYYIPQVTEVRALPQ